MRVRRTVLLLLCMACLPVAAEARYAALGYEPKYAAGFDHFEYVDPDAPQGGHVKLAAFGTFDTLTPFLL